MRRPVTLAPVVVAVAVVAAAGVAHAGPSQDLDKARQSFRSKDCSSVIKVAEPLIYPRSQLASTFDLVEARVLLGVCYYDANRREDARQEFEAVLALQPDKTLDTLLFSVDAVRFFDDVRADVEARARRDAELRKREDENRRIAEVLKNARTFEKRSYAVNFIPFGAGQFQNKHTGKGIALATSQALTGGASAGIFLYLAGKYGLVAKVPVVDGPFVRRLQQIEIGTGIAFLGLYALGVVDSLLNYKATVQVEADQDVLDLLDSSRPRAPARPKPPRSLRERIHVGPVLLESGAGLGISLEDF